MQTESSLIVIDMEEKMELYMNEPVECNWTEEDIINEYEKIQDKKKVARIYCIATKEVTEIIKRKKD